MDYFVGKTSASIASKMSEEIYVQIGNVVSAKCFDLITSFIIFMLISINIDLLQFFSKFNHKTYSRV